MSKASLTGKKYVELNKIDALGLKCNLDIKNKM